MHITFKEIKDFKPKELQDLFLSVKWEAGRKPEKLAIALKQSDTVFSAWYGEKLVGLINALDDGIITAYIHFLLVDPAYQGKGIGKELLRMAANKYKDYLRIVLICDDEETEFYQKNGFKPAKGTIPLFVNRQG